MLRSTSTLAARLKWQFQEEVLRSWFKLVTTTSTCHAFYEGHCYTLRKSDDRNPNLIASDIENYDDWPPEEVTQEASLL
ncbi:hypothetical protein MRX96_058901 [Rhipicephalus microplus]